MTEKNLDYAGVWAEIKAINPRLSTRDFHMYWHVNTGIEMVAEKYGVAAEVVRGVLGEAPDGWDPDSV